MTRWKIWGVTILAVIAGGASARNQEFGTFAQAKAMLHRAIAEVRADKQRAFDGFNANDPRFRDRDLFVFCFGTADGKFSAHEALVSHDVRTLTDGTGTRYGEEMLRVAIPNKIAEVSYVSAIPGKTSQVPKRAFVTRIDDYVCGVSAYRLDHPESPAD